MTVALSPTSLDTATPLPGSAEAFARDGWSASGFFVSATAMRLLLARFTPQEALVYIAGKFSAGKKTLFSCDIA